MQRIRSFTFQNYRIRLLKWLRQEFTVRSENVSQRVTELKSVVDFFEQRWDGRNFVRYSSL